jgi:polyisoprenoid-binding protein YceI
MNKKSSSNMWLIFSHFCEQEYPPQCSLFQRKNNTMKKALPVALLILTAATTFGQNKYTTSTGVITFHSHTPIQDIEATHENVTAGLDIKNGEITVSVMMTGFEFEKKLMQKHFNDNYVESDKYPRSTFNGFITNNDDIDYTKSGSQTAKVSGDLTIHGVTRKVAETGALEVLSDGIIAQTSFMLNPRDYDIKIPWLVRRNIAEDLEIKVNIKLVPVQ